MKPELTKKLINTYGWYNGIPIRKTWDGNIILREDITTEDAIKEHNQSPISCTGDNCRMCLKVEKEKRDKDKQDEYDDD